MIFRGRKKVEPLVRGRQKAGPLVREQQKAAPIGREQQKAGPFVRERQKAQPFVWLARVHALMASLVFLLMLYRLWQSHSFQYLIFAFLAALFTILQLVGLRWTDIRCHPRWSNRFIISAFLLCVLFISIFVHNAILICIFFLAAIPLSVTVSGQLKQLPAVLFLTFVASAGALLVDLVLPMAPWRLMAQGRQIWLMAGAGFIFYLVCLVLITYQQYGKKDRAAPPKITVATQYALVFTGISAMVIILVTGVMIHQIRNAQLNQVGKSFQTIAENFAKLVGSHLEQQIQKLQMLTQQVPILKEGLLRANAQYIDRNDARRQLAENNRLWAGPQKDTTFIMTYLNDPINKALSRFRGHNSFHDDIVLVDRYGGLVTSLGQRPERFYFYDQPWWEITWNGGLGNIFVGDLSMDLRTRIPKLRIAVDIIDHSSNDVIGMLSSTYLLRTLLEDIQRFKPDSVDHISLTDAHGQLIACTQVGITDQFPWTQLKELTEPKSSADSGWVLDRDHLNQAALIGFSTLSTAYNAISDPLHRLGWHVVVSGTRSNALINVRQSTKLAMLVGLVAMALGVLGAIAAARVITRPIENLTATASAMIKGNLDQRARLAGPEELVELSAGFNRLTDRLHRVIRNLKTQTKQLAKAKRSAEDATKLKGEFLANMSHEIRTPLNAILGFAHILESSIEDEKHKRHAQTIKTSGADLLHLINDILDLSKIEAGRMEIEIGPVDLRNIFADLQRIFSISAEEKKIALEMTVSADLPKHLLLDRVRLRQVLFNLIGNAVKFTDQGWVKCMAVGSPLNNNSAWDLTIDVSDTGIGIDPKAHTSIFETFEQHPGESGTTYEGTGLGLAISKSLIEMMGGRINVHGQPGHGSVFSIHIPGVGVSDDRTFAMAEIDLAGEAGEVCFEPASILVADDLEVNRQLIIELLKPYPLKIEPAEHGRAAVKLAVNNRYDLILMDIRMPGMDGYSALKKIRHHLDGDTPCVIATTAAGMKEDIAKIQQAGFDDYIIRPFDQDALVRLLMHHLPHERTGESAPRLEAVAPMTASAIMAQPPWTCPPQAKDHLFATLKHRWEQVCLKQSIPDIIAFANEVKSAGDRYEIDTLSRYGQALADHAEGFDIYNVEKLLPIYEVIINCGVHDSGEDA